MMIKKFFNELFRTLFHVGLLPARHKEKNVRFEIRESGFLGWFSYYKGLQPAFINFLKKKNVKYRIKKTLDYSPTICFWSDEDHKVYTEACKIDRFIADETFAPGLKELDIDYYRDLCGGSKHTYWYQVFCPTRMVELMLRCDVKPDKYQPYIRTLSWPKD